MCMYKPSKCSTDHLYCVKSKDLNNQIYYEIWEKNVIDKPIVIYIDNNNMKVDERLPLNLFEYKYFSELQYLLQMLYDLYENGGFDNGTI